VEIGDGCATVTGYKLPKPLSALKGEREGGARSEARSQDTGLAALVVIIGSGSSTRPARINFSVKEKDETSPAEPFSAASLNTFILRFGGV
jgi:hypothetical protein